MEGQETNQQPETNKQMGQPTKPNNEKINAQEVAESEHKGGTGAFIASVIIILIIIAGGYYFWNNTKDLGTTEGDETPATEDESIDEIEEDLDDTDVENVDEELAEIEAEFDAALNEL